MGGLAACGSASEAPTPTPTAEPTSATPSPDPEPADPLPEEPEAPVPNGTPDERDAEVAAEYFVELYEYTLATGDLTTWEARSLEKCQFCARTSENVRELRDEGLTYRGGAFSIEPARFVAFDDSLRMFAVEVPFSVDEAELIDSEASVIRRLSADTGFLVLEMGYSPEAGWLLRTGNAEQESAL